MKSRNHAGMWRKKTGKGGRVEGGTVNRGVKEGAEAAPQSWSEAELLEFKAGKLTDGTNSCSGTY